MTRRTGFRQSAMLAFCLTWAVVWGGGLVQPCVVQAQTVLKVGVPESMPPFAFVDSRLGSIRGFCVDLAVLLAAQMKSKVEFYIMSEMALNEALLAGKIDMISGAVLRPGQEQFIQRIETDIKIERKFFVHQSCLTVTCTKDLPGQVVVLEKGRNLGEIHEHISRSRIVESASSEDALKLLNEGGAMVYISPSSLSSLYLIQKNNFKNIKEVGLPIETLPLALAVRKDKADLLTELSLGFGKILESETYSLLKRKWLGQDIHFEIWNNYLKYIVMALGVSAGILLFFAVWNRMLKRKVRVITADLARSEHRYRELIESSPDMIHLITADGQIRLANKIALEGLGYNEAEMISVSLMDLVAPAHQGRMTAFISRLFQAGYGHEEFTFRSRTEEGIPVDIIGTTISGSGNPPALACCFSRDMAERKRLEEELIQSERLAVMGQMAAGVAHEINNPLGIILVNAQEILHQNLVEEEQRQGLESIERNAIRAGRIIDDLLSFTRPGPPSLEPINLVELVNESLIFLKPRIKKRRIKIDKDFSDVSIIIQGDGNQIQQLLINLLLNSIEAMPYGGQVRIRISTTVENDNRRVLLEVEDQGKGIPETDLAKVFDPFFTSKEAGFGLGLFISKFIVDRHGGRIAIWSKVGQGTKMHIELPMFRDTGDIHQAEPQMQPVAGRQLTKEMFS